MTSLRKARGQGMTEYIVIVALIGVAAIGAYSFLGSRSAAPPAALALEIAGEDAKGGIDEAKKASDEAVQASQSKATLKDYNASNH
jgi:hypothetical protein